MLNNQKGCTVLREAARQRTKSRRRRQRNRNGWVPFGNEVFRPEDASHSAYGMEEQVLVFLHQPRPDYPPRETAVYLIKSPLYLCDSRPLLRIVLPHVVYQRTYKSEAAVVFLQPRR